MTDELIRAQMAEIDRLRAELEALKTTHGPVEPNTTSALYLPGKPQGFDESNYADAPPQGRLRITDSALAQMRRPSRYRRNRDFGGS